MEKTLEIPYPDVLHSLPVETLVEIVKVYFPLYRSDGVPRETIIDDILDGESKKPYLAKVLKGRHPDCTRCSDTGLIPPYEDMNYCDCPAGGSRRNLVSDCLGLSGSTMANLVGDNKYQHIDAVQRDFVLWAAKNIVLYPDWRTAWEAYRVESESSYVK